MSQKKHRYKNAKEKRDGGRFLSMPVEVMRSVAYTQLGSSAKVLLFELLLQYRGDNNGDLCAAHSMLRERGFPSESTLFAARKELKESGLVWVTRTGARPNRATLYGLTFLALDENPKLEVTARTFPRGQWRMKDPVPPLKPVAKNASSTTVFGVRHAA